MEVVSGRSFWLMLYLRKEAVSRSKCRRGSVSSSSSLLTAGKSSVIAPIKYGVGAVTALGGYLRVIVQL